MVLVDFLRLNTYGSSIGIGLFIVMELGLQVTMVLVATLWHFVKIIWHLQWFANCMAIRL